MIYARTVACAISCLSRVSNDNTSFKYLAFGLDLVAIRLVLGLEIKVLVGWTEEHLTTYCQHLHTAGLLVR